MSSYLPEEKDRTYNSINNPEIITLLQNVEVQTRMGYTIRDFINSNKFPGMKLISDNSGINREIKGTRIIAVPDMEKFLGGGW